MKTYKIAAGRLQMWLRAPIGRPPRPSGYRRLQDTSPSDAVIERLLPFDVPCEWDPRPATSLNPAQSQAHRLDGIWKRRPMSPPAERAWIAVVHTGYRPTHDQLTLALILASAPHLAREQPVRSVAGSKQWARISWKDPGRSGTWAIGSQVARVGSAFEEPDCLSQNMTAEAATAAGAILVSKEQLFERPTSDDPFGVEQPYGGS